MCVLIRVVSFDCNCMVHVIILCEYNLSNYLNCKIAQNLLLKGSHESPHTYVISTKICEILYG